MIFVSACNAQPPVGAVGVMQLSEPLLWFILRVLDKESALEHFNRMGGVRVCINYIILQNLKFKYKCLPKVTDLHTSIAKVSTYFTVFMNI